MPRFEPFRGLRYAPDVLADNGVAFDDVIAPPYDVIDAAGREMLAGRSSYNSVRVELPEPDPSRGLDRYAAAADLIREWGQEGVVALDDAPSFYAYRM
ncbi:MAG: DUF1015 family protein, partial [Acidimicrobiales bacterium]